MVILVNYQRELGDHSQCLREGVFLGVRIPNIPSEFRDAAACLGLPWTVQG